MRLSLTLVVFTISMGCASPDAAQRPPAPDFPELENIDLSGGVDCTGDYTAAITGRIVDDEGTPVEGARAQLCIHRTDGNFICLSPALSEVSGWWVRAVAEEHRCIDRVALRATSPLDRIATSYCPVDLAVEEGIYEHPVDIVVYELDDVALPPIGDENAPREVTIGDGLVLTNVVPERFFGRYEEIGATRVEAPCFAEGMNLDGVYALGPEALPSEEGFGVRIPNTTGLPDGTRVELFILGGLFTVLLDETVVEESTLAKFGEGTVTGDTIVGDPEARLTELTWLAYRAL